MDVLIRVQNVELFLEGSLDKQVRDEIQGVLSYSVPNFKFLKRYKQEQEKARLGLLSREPWDGKITIAKKYYGQNGILRAPTGLLSYVREILDKNNVTYSIREERNQVVNTTGYDAPALFSILRDYQVEAVDMTMRRNRGIIKMGTGAGKTECVIATIVRAAAFPSVFYVTSCDLLEQAYDRFRKYVINNGEVADIGRIGAGHCDIRPITIATVQSCQRVVSPHGKHTKSKFDDYTPDDNTRFTEEQKKSIKDMVCQAQFVYLDEVQHCAAETIQDILNASHGARFRVGGSASPWRDDGLDILIEACFGRRLCDVTSSFLIRQGYLIKPYITFNHFNQMLIPVKDWQSHYKAYVVENDERNAWIASRANFHVEKDRPTIILVKWARHAEILKDIIPGSEVLTSSGEHATRPKERKEILNQMRSRKLMCIIGTSLLDEGIDVPAAGAGIFAGGGKSSTRELQRVGRFIRKDDAYPDKQCAYIEEFHDHTKWLSYQSKTRREILATEPEFEIDDKRII